LANAVAKKTAIGLLAGEPAEGFLQGVTSPWPDPRNGSNDPRI
jgi:hypothetical protein